MGYIIIKTTFDNKKDAEVIANKLLNEKLVACIQLSEVESYYKWNNKNEKSHEYKLEIKTSSNNYGKVEEVIVKNHKYKIPEVVAYAISHGNKKYLNWIKQEISK